MIETQQKQLKNLCVRPLTFDNATLSQQLGSGGESDTEVKKPGLPSRAPELGILPGAGAQIKNQELEPGLSLKFRTGARAVAIWEVAPSPSPFLDTSGFGK